MATYKAISKNFTFASDFAGGDNLIKIASATADGDSVINFTSGIDSTYNVYYVVYNAIHPAAGSKLTCQFTTNGSDFNLALATAQSNGSNTEAGSASNNNADASEDQNDGTAYQSIAYADTIETNAESCCNGVLWLYGPSSTTFHKHFSARSVAKDDAPGGAQTWTSGEIATAAAVTGISFKMSSGNIDSGTFTLYGLGK
jgi:hypothetical protein